MAGVADPLSAGAAFPAPAAGLNLAGFREVHPSEEPNEHFSAAPGDAQDADPDGLRGSHPSDEDPLQSFGAPQVRTGAATVVGASKQAALSDASHPPSPPMPPLSPSSPASPSQAAAKGVDRLSLVALPDLDAGGLASTGVPCTAQVVEEVVAGTGNPRDSASSDSELAAAISAALNAQLHVHATPVSCTEEEDISAIPGRNGTLAAAEIEVGSSPPTPSSGEHRASFSQTMMQRARQLSAAMMGAGSAGAKKAGPGGAAAREAAGRISFSDIARSPSLALAARAELDGDTAARPDNHGAEAESHARQVEVRCILLFKIPRGLAFGPQL